MNERPFLDKSNKPTEQAVQAALGSTYAFYTEITGRASAYAQEWKFIKSSGWMLKIQDRKKALLYLIPLKEGFKVSLTLRENEREIFLRDGELERLHAKLSSSIKYPEGFALQFEIASPDEFPLLDLFIRKLLTIRG